MPRHSTPFIQDTRRVYGPADGLPEGGFDAVLATPGAVYAGGPGGLFVSDGETWRAVDALRGVAVAHLAAGPGGAVWAASMTGALFRIEGGAVAGEAECPAPATALAGRGDGSLLVATADDDLHLLRDGRWATGDRIAQRPENGARILRLAAHGDRMAAAGTTDGLFLWTGDSWIRLRPTDGARRWDPLRVAAVVFDPSGALWFGSSEGVGAQVEGGWLLLGRDAGALPYAVEAGACNAVSSEAGAAWFATPSGLMRYARGRGWSVRAGRRWLPPGALRCAAAAADGGAWVATTEGLGRIERRGMTLSEKAEHYERAIEERHVRLGHFVAEVELDRPGDVAAFRRIDTDNDGLWTAMYGAGQCFHYAATGNETARERARRSFEGLLLLTEATGIPGFPARALVPVDGPDPNAYFSAAWNAERKARDPLWKEIVPRWPRTADGRFYWKCDTSSDELDGHYFFYGLYHDLAAGTPEEKGRVAQQVRAITDHLLDHDYCLVDHDGLPTRWARFNPQELNHDPEWRNERGLNSLSMLSYLRTASHMTGDPRYTEAARDLIENHSYLVNLFHQKITFPPGEINDSDDEMAFMCYYNLIRYESDPDLLAAYRESLERSWRFERGERSPLFNFMYNALMDQIRDPSDLEASIDTLERFPLELVTWKTVNSDRLDVAREGESDDPWGGGVFQRRAFSPWPGVLPVDERGFLRWNENPWRLDHPGGQGVSWFMEGKPEALARGGEGLCEYDGHVFLLPFYMGLYHGYLA